MAEIDAIKDYLKKLRKAINFEAAFVFFDIGIYKKTKLMIFYAVYMQNYLLRISEL